MDISKPTLGSATLPFPSAASIKPIWIYSDNTTLGGTTRRDIMARKYEYILSWDYMSVADYDSLETVINTLSYATFIYGKWPQSESPGVSCLGVLSERNLIYGVGDSSYLSSVTLTLTEVSSRI